MIYVNSRELRRSDMDEVQKFILSLLKSEEKPTTRALKAKFISSELLTRYCKLIGHKYPDHICSKYSLQHEKKSYLNLNPRSITTKDPNQYYTTQKLQGYNKLIAQQKTNANLVKTCYNYGFISTAYSYDGEESNVIPELYKAFIIYKRVTKENLFYIKFYTATAEILNEEIKSPIEVVKIGLPNDMIIPEDSVEQPEIPKIEIPSFYANKRIIDISTIIEELDNNYLNGYAIWSYYFRDQLMIYANSRGTKEISYG
ncbi:hypothetical protein H5410_026632 [Solanum commersonii]|uniref:Uncharacterized protein n=1 Tax=Solanum commersonii TaxID=4109 RepID=A0A9J5Z181_SOLCO|nr:hypothetical protein H5410_026632 [Solanum commersonii]